MDLVTCLITFGLYFKIYLNHKKQLNKIKVNDLFNHIAFDMNISFTIAWNVCFLTITSAGFINNFYSNDSNIYNINLIFQFLLTLICILALAYFGDIYFAIIIVIFQIGNTINKHLFDFEINKQDFNDKQNIQLVLTLFTIICLLGGAIKKQKNIIKLESEKTNEDKEINEINDHYFENNNR